MMTTVPTRFASPPHTRTAATTAATSGRHRCFRLQLGFQRTLQCDAPLLADGIGLGCVSHPIDHHLPLNGIEWNGMEWNGIELNLTAPIRSIVGTEAMALLIIHPSEKSTTTYDNNDITK